jgi:hypothetical protein
MRSKQLACLLALIVISGAGAPPLEACGDKFLALGRGMSLNQSFASLHPGVIAIYTRDPAGAAEAFQSLRKILTRAGHRVSIVGSDTLGPLVKAAGVDIVLASVTDADAVSALIDTARPHPTVLYVAPRGRVAVLRASVSPVAPALKPDDKAATFLRVVEDAMTERSRAGVRVKPA